MTRQKHLATQCQAVSAKTDQSSDKPSSPERAEPQESLWSALLPATPCEVVTRSIATAGLLVLLYVGFVLLYSHLP